MRGVRIVAGLVVLVAGRAMAQPADCPPTLPALGSPLPLSIDLKGRPGVPSGLTGKAFVAVPVQAPPTACGAPPPAPDVPGGAPGNVLGGPPGDLLRGTPAPTGR